VTRRDGLVPEEDLRIEAAELARSLGPGWVGVVSAGQIGAVGPDGLSVAHGDCGLGAWFVASTSRWPDHGAPSSRISRSTPEAAIDALADVIDEIAKAARGRAIKAAATAGLIRAALQ
jgi:hypothetical protein